MRNLNKTTNVTLTVEYDKVLRFVHMLLKNEITEMLDSTDVISAIKDLEAAMKGCGDIRHALIHLDNHRRVIAERDLRIKECMAILEGFFNSEVNNQIETLAEASNASSNEEFLSRIEKEIEAQRSQEG